MSGPAPNRLAEQWAEWLAEIVSDGLNLTAWESQFISDLQERFEKYGSLKLSERQAAQLERIYSERTP